MLTLLTGGARSGKSSAAVQLAEVSGRPVVFIATAEAHDEEMRARIEHHRETRPSEWRTVEAPRDLTRELAAVDAESAVIVDCVALWVTNRLDDEDSQILADGRSFAGAAATRPGPTIVVTNEVGSGIVPANALARRFRDLLGGVNQDLARASDQAFLCVAGGVLPLASIGDLVP